MSTTTSAKTSSPRRQPFLQGPWCPKFLSSTTGIGFGIVLFARTHPLSQSLHILDAFFV